MPVENKVSFHRSKLSSTRRSRGFRDMLGEDGVLSRKVRGRHSRRLSNSFVPLTGQAALIPGTMGGKEALFLVAAGKAAYGKHLFRIGDTVGGESYPVISKQTEIAGLYKTGKLKILRRGVPEETKPPP